LKKRIYLMILFCAAVLLLASCGYEAKFVGTWEGSGDFLLNGIPVETLIFNPDGTAAAMGDSGSIEFEYVATDDTLTFRFPEYGYGTPYKIKGDELILRRESVFVRTNN